MAEVDPTQRDLTTGIAAELAAAGFEDVDEIGRGGFGVVYRCVQPSLDRTVAIKVLTADLEPDNLQRFLREQRAMGKLSGHPHIVSVFQVGATASGRPYIVMQYHPAGSLDARIHKVGPIDWGDAVHIGVEVAGALETAHRLGTLHRDVKPGNILLTEYGEPQLTDFGIARIAGGFETATGVVMGSPAFTAPEVLQGETPTAAADVYGLGATLFCAITGHAAFERRSGEQVVAQFLRIANQPVPDLREAGIPGDVSAAIEVAMARHRRASRDRRRVRRAVAGGPGTTRNAGRRDARTGCVGLWFDWCAAQRQELDRSAQRRGDADATRSGDAVSPATAD
jgi:serine/threonine-protein kinase PknK